MTEPQESPQPTEEPFDPGADEVETVETVEGCGLEVDPTPYPHPDQEIPDE